MNESQERREELLRMSRQKWRKGSIPAVHPRYQHVYRGLYGEHSSEENGGSSFFARMFISFLIFVVEIPVQAGEKHFKYEQKRLDAFPLQLHNHTDSDWCLCIGRFSVLPLLLRQFQEAPAPSKAGTNDTGK